MLAGPILWMNGTDHLVPQLRLGRLVAEANALQDDYELEVTSLAQHLAHCERRRRCPRGSGELRSGARANLLMGVTSNRVDVRQAAARAEASAGTRREHSPRCISPSIVGRAALLHEAWLHVVRNAAHDSICACSIDEVCDAVLYRYAEAAEIGEGLAQRALDALGASVTGDGPVIVEPDSRDPDPASSRSSCRAPSERPGAQILNERPAERVVAELDLVDDGGRRGARVEAQPSHRGDRARLGRDR